MNIIKAYAVKNLCYIAAQKMTPQGLVVHSTAASNPNLKRYVDCRDEVGINIYRNHWNKAKPGGRKVCVHAFIDYDKNKVVRVAEILPLNICCWGVGSGKKGSYNYDPAHIQFEICEDGLKDRVYYEKAFAKAAEYCAYLCKKYGLSVKQIVSHKEAYKKGYGNNHGDPEHWMQKFGETMDDFRNRVAALLDSSDNIVSGDIVVQTNSTSICSGDLVSIANDATYYNGKKIPDWVKSDNWYVKGDPKEDRVVIDKNEKGTNSICSPINSKYLKVVRSHALNTKDACVESSHCPYLVRVISDSLYIRKGAGSNTAKVGLITDKGIYSIVQEKLGTGATAWGKLKSGAGWISLDYVKKYKIRQSPFTICVRGDC